MENEKFDRRGKSLNKNKLRNLPQYRDKTDEELDILLAEREIISNVESKNLESRIEEKLNKFSDDYDLSDLKENDKASLRAMIQAIIALEDYEQLVFTLRKSIDSENLLIIDKVSKIMEGLRKGISDFENNLNITRKHRKSDQEASVLSYIESLKQKAREFYESRMSYIFCPRCHTLLGTIWTLYPEEGNKIELICKQKDKNGNPCDTRVVVGTKELLENKGTNERDVMPDALL